MSVEECVRLVRRKQGGLLLDTNVVLLHLIANTPGGSFSGWKRTQQFTQRHTQLLDLLVRAAKRLTTTPHVLTQVTDLSNGLPASIRERYRAKLREFVVQARERWVPAGNVALDPEFAKYGLADIAQARLQEGGRPVIVTVDAGLTALLERRHLPVINLNHHVFGVIDAG